MDDLCLRGFVQRLSHYDVALRTESRLPLLPVVRNAISRYLGNNYLPAPEGTPELFWRAWIITTATAGLVVVLALHLHYAGIW